MSTSSSTGMSYAMSAGEPGRTTFSNTTTGPTAVGCERGPTGVLEVLANQLYPDVHGLAYSYDVSRSLRESERSSQVA